MQQRSLSEQPLLLFLGNRHLSFLDKVLLYQVHQWDLLPPQGLNQH